MRIAYHIRRFAADEEGTMLILWGVSFAVMLGIIAMSFDLGRVGITRSELQAYADNVALAAAGELDGDDDAITRARAAAANLISDSQTFGDGGSVLSGDTDFTLTFYSELPASDTAAITAATTDPAEAVYVRAVVTPRSVPAAFGRAFAALTGAQGPNESAAASAVAGFTQYACDVTPLMFCLPPGFSADARVGDMVELRAGGSGASWQPGAFGFLDPSKIKVDEEGPCAGLNGVRLDACLLGAVGSITQCFDMRGVDIEPGQKVGIENAIFNVRFDVFETIMNRHRNDPDYAPAPNVVRRKSTSGNFCRSDDDSIPDEELPPGATLAMPRDDCHPGCGRFGNGNWSAGRTAYVNRNYGGTDPHPGASTRYEYYLEEIAAAGGSSSSTAILPPGKFETGRPMCSNQQSGNPLRRVIIAAGVDCAANPVSGAATDVPVKEFVKIFLTEPVRRPPDLSIIGEVLGSAGGAGGTGDLGIFREVVQLYR